MDSSPAVVPEAPVNSSEAPKEEDPLKSSDVEMKEATMEPVEKSTDQEEPAQEAVKPNGGAEHPVEDHTEPPVDATQASEDTEMKDSSEINPAVEATPKPASEAANGTPASAKRGGNGGSSKKKHSVPEHKSKKLQKKKSRPLTNLDAEPGQYYFARMKGHPPWPSVICDEAMLPVSLLSTRPVTAKLSDGTFKKVEYADGGKRAHERTFPVMFLHTNEFAWIPNTELTPLDPEDDSIKNPAEKGKSKTLLAAYAKAAENNDLAVFKNMLADHQKALAEDQAEREARAAKKVKKSNRKSMDASALADDDMDIDEGEAAEKPKSKKRKKAEDSDGDEKLAKTPKTTTKLKLSEPKDPTESATKKKAAKPKAKATKSSSEEDTKVEEAPLTPEAALGIKERKVLYFRHKLQRSMLNRDSMPKEDEMKSMSDYLSELETYPDLEASIIRKTKIHKVLKNIIKLAAIPLEEQFHFKNRSRDLLAKWNEILANDPSGATSGEHGDGADDKADESKDAAPITNGTTAPEDKTEDTPAEAVAAPESTTVENKIGTSVEGEKEAEQPAADAKPEEVEETVEEKQTDGPAVESAPAAEYKPPAVSETAAETTA